MASAVSEEK